jgi:DNA repair exonuclease SbcCD ATPase subunit
MRLSIDEIELRGFKSYTKQTSLDLSSRGVGLHFVRGRNQQQPALGSNGSGKSSIWGALCWCLYGRTIEGLRNPDVQPWYGDDQTFVTVRLRIDDDVHRVTRSIKPNKLELDGRLVGQDTIDELLRMPVDVFGHTILLGQDQPLFFDLKAQAKLDLFSTVLKLDRWDGYAKAASNRVRNLERKQALLDGQLAGLEREHERVGQQYDAVRELSRQFQAERAREAQAGEEKLTALRAQLDKQEQELGVSDQALDGAAMELKQLAIDIPKAEQDVSTAQTNYEDFKRRDWKATTRVLQLQDELDRLGDGSTCPTCKQPVKGTQLATHQKKLRKDLIAAQSECGIPRVTVRKCKTLTERLHNLKTAERTLRTKADDALAKVKFLQPIVEKVRQEIRALERARESRREELDPHADLAQSLRRTRQQLTQQIREAQNACRLVQRRQVRAKFWVKGFNEVRLYILQELQLVTAGMLGEFGLDGWEVKYAIEQETKSGTLHRGINVMVLSPKNDRFVNWRSWSSGEGQRLRVIGGLALSEVLLSHVGVQSAIEILDEPTQHLSTEGIDDLCELLASRARLMGKQIWFTDHKVIEGAVFTSVLTVIKTKQGSTFSQKHVTPF